MTHLTKTVAAPLWLAALFLFPPGSDCFAFEPQAEIEHLLGFIGRSGCTFIRNGSEYPAAEARGHMEMKYNHAKKKIAKTEQFIEYVATKSSITDRPYLIRCKDREYPSKEWLSVELQRYRNN